MLRGCRTSSPVASRRTIERVLRVARWHHRRKRAALVGTTCRALVDAPGTARSHREAPEIDGVVQVPTALPVGSWAQLEIVDVIGPDLVGTPVAETR